MADAETEVPLMRTQRYERFPESRCGSVLLPGIIYSGFLILCPSQFIHRHRSVTFSVQILALPLWPTEP